MVNDQYKKPHSKLDFQSLQNQWICEAAMSDGKVKFYMTSCQSSTVVYTDIIESFNGITQ